MAAIAISREDVIDAEFETLTPRIVPVTRVAPNLSPRQGADVNSGQDQLDILRNAFEPQGKTELPDTLSPTFIIFTAIAAFAVFWVSGGHVLLY
jgi:hypothetical protein